MGGWAIAQSPILGTTITKARLRKRGYISLSTMFKMISDNSGMNTLFPMV
jgi:RNA-directed DNA polymerase